MISERQEKVLQFVVREYISSAEPVSSALLKKSSKLQVSQATIRNDLQILTKEGFIGQPHTSAGRVPTKKAYKYFAEKVFDHKERESHFIFEQIERTRQEIEHELEMVGMLMTSLERIFSTLDTQYLREEDNLFEILSVLGPSKINYGNNVRLITEILKTLENL